MCVWCLVVTGGCVVVGVCVWCLVVAGVCVVFGGGWCVCGVGGGMVN